MSTAVATKGMRWSSTRVCARKAVYEAEGAPARERSDREHRILYRGRSLGRDYADFLAARDGQDAVEREVKVEWEFGVGHIDVFHIPTSTAIEVLSSAHASSDMVTSKLLQLVGYMEHYPRAAAGLLAVLDPSDFTEERFPVARGTDAYSGLVEQMHDRIVQLREWRDAGVTPARVCVKPSEAIGRFCLHAAHCFDGWEPEPLERLDDHETLDLAMSWLSAKAREREAAAAVDEAKAERETIQERLAARIDEPGKVLVGPLVVTRSDRVRQGTLDVRKAETAGVPVRDSLAEFFKPDSSYTVWTVQGSGSLPGDTADVDYGEAPF